MVFHWQQSNQMALLLTCVLYELMMYWAWFVLVWFFLDELMPALIPSRVYLFWLICTVFMGVILVLITYVNNRPLVAKHRLHQLDNGLAVLGVFYITMIFLVNGGDTLYLGVSLVSTTLLFIMLGNKHTTWYSFLAQLLTVMILSLMDFLGIELPTLYDSKMLYQIEVKQSFSGVFLQTSLLMFATLKAFFSVKVLKQLMHLFDESRRVLQYQADHDTMTGVKNRRYAIDWLQKHLFDINSYQHQKHQHEPQDLSVILLDIDFFKRINDTHGHGAGDEVLKEVARRLQQQSQEYHYRQKSSEMVLISRYGGEEFLVVMRRTTHDNALKYADRLRRCLADVPVYVPAEKTHIEVTASFGVASLSDAEINALRVDLIRHMSKPEETDSTELTTMHINAINDNELKNNDQKNIDQKNIDQNINDHKNSLTAKHSWSNVQDKAMLVAVRQQKLKADFFIRQDRSIDNIINMADVALYDAKKMGRNCVISAMQTISIDTLLEDGFSLSGSYQPSKA